MEVDQDPQGQGTPLGTPFEDGFTPSTTHGNTTADPSGSIRTENNFTPLYTESQETDHTNVNANQRPPPIHEDTRNENLADVAAAAETEADDIEAEAAVANATDLIARVAAEVEAAAVAEATSAEAVAKATTDTAARLTAEEAATAEAAKEAKRVAEASEAAARAQEAAAAAEAKKVKHEALEAAAAVAAARAKAEAVAAAAATQEKGKKVRKRCPKG
jgi:electron transfer flavoprotein alpha subunit